MFNYDEWVSNHERIYNMKGSVWQDQKAFGRIAVEAALKLVEGQKPPTNNARDEIPDGFSLQCETCGEHFSEVYHALDHAESCHR